MRLRTLALLTAALLWAGCASDPPPPSTARSSYGAYPKNYEQVIRSHFQRILDVSEGTHFAFGKPRAGYMRGGVVGGQQVVWYGFLVDVHIASKSLALERAQEFVVRLKDGEVIDVHDGFASQGLHDLEPTAKPPPPPRPVIPVEKKAPGEEDFAPLASGWSRVRGWFGAVDAPPAAPQ